MLIVLFQRSKRRRFRFYRLKFGIMGIVTVGTEIVSPSASDEVSGPFPVDTRFPIAIDVAVTLSAEPIALGEIDQFSVEKAEFVPIVGVVAVEAPPHGLGVVEFDVYVLLFEFSSFSIDLHAGMAVTAGKDSLREGRRGDRKLLHSHGGRDKINHHEKNGYK